jgi:hypothetical protein
MLVPSFILLFGQQLTSITQQLFFMKHLWEQAKIIVGQLWVMLVLSFILLCGCILKNSYNFVIELSHRGME